MKGGRCKARLSAVSLGVAFGVTSAICMALIAWSSYYWGMGGDLVAQWAAFYPGFAATVKGGFFGGAWGFLEGFVFGVIFGWIYNLCLCCCGCCCKSSCACKSSCEKCDSTDKKME